MFNQEEKGWVIKNIFVIVIPIVVIFSGCTTNELKRAGYETLQNIQQYECDKEPLSDCPERESFDEYQQKREESLGQP
ncbi:MAG: hypothetical protein ACE5EH_02075 [Gammaproteobacteria bacterium]